MRFLQEHIAGAQTVQIFNAEEKSLRQFAKINDEHRKANIDTIFYYAVFFPLVDFIGAVGIALIIWYGGYRVMQDALYARRAGRVHSILEFSVPADSRHLRQVQRAAGRRRRVASNLQGARSADCRSLRRRSR